MGDYNKAALELIVLMEQAKQKMESLRVSTSGFDMRALSIAITEMETAQLRLANARPVFGEE